MNLRTRYVVFALLSAGCDGGWPVVIGTGQDDGVLAVAASSEHVFVAGIEGRADGSGRMMLRGFDLDGVESWAQTVMHRPQNANYAGGLVRSIVVVPGTTDFVAGGEFHGQLDLPDIGTMISVDEPTSELPGGDLLFGRWTAEGDPAWVLQLGGPGLDDAIAIDANVSRIGVTGRFHEQISVGGSVLVAVDGPGAMPGYSGDVLVASYDREGSHLWSRSGGGTASDTPTGIDLDATGQVTVVGSFGLTTNLGGSDLVSIGGGDGFVARYSADGGHLWSKSFGGASGDAALAVATDGDGRVVVAGFVEGGVDVGGGTLMNYGGVDGLVAMFDAFGDHVWSITIGGSGRDLVTGLAFHDGSIVIVGNFEETLSAGITARGGTDAFIAWVERDTGSVTRAIALGGTNQDSGSDLTASLSVLYVGGAFTDSAILGAGSRNAHGGSDGFVARFED